MAQHFQVDKAATLTRQLSDARAEIREWQRTGRPVVEDKNPEGRERYCTTLWHKLRGLFNIRYRPENTFGTLTPSKKDSVNYKCCFMIVKLKILFKCGGLLFFYCPFFENS